MQQCGQCMNLILGLVAAAGHADVLSCILHTTYLAAQSKAETVNKLLLMPTLQLPLATVRP